MKERNNIQLDIDFVGIGTAKAATTWIYECLSEHPEIYMSKIKESHLFRKKYYQIHERYQECFRDASPGQIKGEFTPGNMISPANADRIFRHAPKAKLIACLRDPIDRITSMCNYAWVSGKPFVSFEEVVRGYKSSCAYYQQLEPYLKLFPRDNILILIYEDIEKNPAAFIKNIYTFLGVDANFVPSAVSKRTNVTSSNSTRFFIIHKILLWLRHKLKNGPKGSFVTRVMRSLKVNKLVSFVLQKNTRPEAERISLDKQEMSEELKQELREYLREDIDSLEKLLGRELIEWSTRASYRTG